MCGEPVVDCLTALKVFPDWFVTSKMIKKLFTILYIDDNILHFNEDSGNVVFSCNEMDIHNIDLMVEFSFVTRREKRNRTNFYWVMLSMYTIWEYWDVLPPDIVQKSLWISCHFDTQWLDIVKKSLWIASHFEIVQIFFLPYFFWINALKYIFKTICYMS